jgi:hypothetical protein
MGPGPQDVPGMMGTCFDGTSCEDVSKNGVSNMTHVLNDWQSLRLYCDTYV